MYNTASQDETQEDQPKRVEVAWYQDLTKPKGKKPSLRDESSPVGNGQGWRRVSSPITPVLDRGTP